MNKESFRFTSEVVLIDSGGHHCGKLRVHEARQAASDQGLDLIEVGKQNGLSVCCIMDYGKWQYQIKKKKKQNKNIIQSTKEIKFGMRIDNHDQQTKMSHVNKFLEKGHPVRLVIEMRGRERAHSNLAVDKINTLIAELNGSFKDAGEVKKTRGNVSTILHPKKDVSRNGRQIKDERNEAETTGSSKELRASG